MSIVDRFRRIERAIMAGYVAYLHPREEPVVVVARQRTVGPVMMVGGTDMPMEGARSPRYEWVAAMSSGEEVKIVVGKAFDGLGWFWSGSTAAGKTYEGKSDVSPVQAAHRVVDAMLSDSLSVTDLYPQGGASRATMSARLKAAHDQLAAMSRAS